MEDQPDQTGHTLTHRNINKGATQTSKCRHLRFSEFPRSIVFFMFSPELGKTNSYNNKMSLEVYLFYQVIVSL